jgi:acetylornithine/succinyldiaminopimelate/putrescine aminotransferase
VGQRDHSGLLSWRRGGDGIHLLGPLAKKVIRISPPLTITEAEAQAAMELMNRLAAGIAEPQAALAGVDG